VRESGSPRAPSANRMTRQGAPASACGASQDGALQPSSLPADRRANVIPQFDAHFRQRAPARPAQFWRTTVQLDRVRLFRCELRRFDPRSRGRTSERRRFGPDAAALSLRRPISAHRQSSHPRGCSDAHAARNARCAASFSQQRVYRGASHPGVESLPPRLWRRSHDLAELVGEVKRRVEA